MLPSALQPAAIPVGAGLSERMAQQHEQAREALRRSHHEIFVLLAWSRRAAGHYGHLPSPHALFRATRLLVAGICRGPELIGRIAPQLRLQLR